MIVVLSLLVARVPYPCLPDAPVSVEPPDGIEGEVQGRARRMLDRSGGEDLSRLRGIRPALVDGSLAMPRVVEAKLGCEL